MLQIFCIYSIITEASRSEIKKKLTQPDLPTTSRASDGLKTSVASVPVSTQGELVNYIYHLHDVVKHAQKRQQTKRASCRHLDGKHKPATKYNIAKIVRRFKILHGDVNIVNLIYE